MNLSKEDDEKYELYVTMAVVRRARDSGITKAKPFWEDIQRIFPELTLDQIKKFAQPAIEAMRDSVGV